jgi:hypothetical protein
MAEEGLRRGFRGGQGGGVNTLTGHLEARSWAADVGESGGDLWQRGRGEEGVDFSGPTCQ